MEMLRPVWAEVDLGVLKRNYNRIKTYTNSEVMPVVKADAYGHGAIPVVKALWEVGAKRFGVALLEEGIELRQVFKDIDIMVIGAVPMEYADILVEHNIIPEIFQYEQAKALSNAAVKRASIARLHLKIDTGMGRIGFKTSEVEEILKIGKLPGLMIEGIYTHFATADQKDLTFARDQLRRFTDFCNLLEKNGLKIPLRHASNSAAVMQVQEAHMNLVRPGIILYGLPPSAQVGMNAGFEPVLSWKARVAHVKTIETGESVGYGRTFKAAFPTKVATIPVGYADGLRRALSNRGEVLIHGMRSTIIGRVCMDQAMLEVTKIPDVKIGDIVTILGTDGNDRIDASEMANLVGTINYEILCGISKRVPRKYL